VSIADVEALVAMGAVGVRGEIGGVRYHTTRCGGAVHVAWDVARSPCRCPEPDETDGVCSCGGSLWECCGRSDSEPHRVDCHTRRADSGVFVCAGDRWAVAPLPKGWYGRSHGAEGGGVS
jgi:hypothetical protein